MAFQSIVTPLPSTMIDGRRHMGWEITQTDVPPSGEAGWSLQGLPVYFTVTLFQAVRATGSTGTIQPRLATAKIATTPSLDEVFEDAGGNTKVRNDSLIRVTSPCGQLYGWAASTVSTDTVTFRIAIIEGHQ